MDLGAVPASKTMARLATGKKQASSSTGSTDFDLDQMGEAKKGTALGGKRYCRIKLQLSASRNKCNIPNKMAQLSIAAEPFPAPSKAEKCIL